MNKYYTRACNFYYGTTSKTYIKKKKSVPLNGNNQISFDKSCTMCSIKKFHSFRRDGEFAGRNICYLSIN